MSSESGRINCQLFQACPKKEPGCLGVFLLLLVILGVSTAMEGQLGAQTLHITEFMAANASGERDGDSDYSDWIEIYNADQKSASLKGWYLTDDPKEPAKWRFPELMIPSQGHVIVFASGKNRLDSKGYWHANFSLDRDGEYLALIQPDGVTVASEFAPAFPRQVANLSYGRTMTIQSEILIAFNATGRLLVPDNDQLGRAWTQPGFEDGPWAPAAMAVGYDRTNSSPITPPEPDVTLTDVTRPGDVIVATSSNSPGNEGVANAIDNNPQTKYLNFDKLNAGLTVTPKAGLTAVTGLRLTSANDAPDRDPTSFLLLGSNDGKNFTEIARGTIPLFSGRFTQKQIFFTNTLAFFHYRLLFPTVQNAAAAVAVQIAEVELLGRIGGFAPSFSELIKTDLETALYGRRSSVYLRFPVVLQEMHRREHLALQVRYEDGFVAWLNGVEVARANAPLNVAYNSVATTNRAHAAAVYEQRFDLSSFASLLQTGTNILAIQGLNDRSDSPDFLVQAQLENTHVILGESGYFQNPTPGSENYVSSPGLLPEVLFSQPRGLYENPLDLILSCLEGAAIHFTTNGSAPSLTNGFVYTSPIRLSRTTMVRAAAFREGWVPSPAVTHSYIFLSDVIAQRQASALAAGFPSTWGGQTPDYGLDPSVIGPTGQDKYGGKYARTIQSDLRSIPTMSLVMDMGDMFGPQGIYSNPLGRGEAWERPVSVEWIDPAAGHGFQADVGLRIQGGAFRRFDLSLKKSFRLIFREKYDDTELKFPLFGPEAADHFKNFVLRANSNDAWPYGGGKALYIRDAFAMETARAMGMTASHTTFVHLYINGFYWGLYNPVERPDAAFSASYFGGDRDDWDAINQDSVPDGNRQAWDRLLALLRQDMTKNENYQRLRGNNPDGTPNPAYENLLDVDNMIDYLILNFYAGNTDWPGRNWWVGRNRNSREGFRFFPWDTETALGFSGLEADVTGASGAVAEPYAMLRNNAEFRLRFADHAYRHFYLGGALYVNPTNTAWNVSFPENNRPAARFVSLANMVDRAMVGESARWGDHLNRGLFTRDEHWQKERDSMLASFFPRRSALVLEQLRRAKLYPRTEPPVMNQRGGPVAPGFQVILSAPLGTIYYTTNGVDPRTPVTGLADRAQKYVQPIVLHDLTTLKTRVLNGLEWSALNEASFVVGSPALVITELHYHPAAPTSAERADGFDNADDFEFIEFYNNGVGSFDLSGVRIVSGIQFDFASSAVSKLSAGDYLLLVKNRRAFEKRYGAGHSIAGEYSGQLSNSGERLQVINRQGESILDFTYGTRPPWPQAADGDGFSLEVYNTSGDLNLPSNWRCSASPDGSPGKANPAPTLILEKATLRNGQLCFQLANPSSAGYTLYVSDSLTPDSWRILHHIDTSPPDPMVEISLPADFPTRFFRISMP